MEDDYCEIVKSFHNIELAIISPEFTKRMLRYAELYKKMSVSYIFDPGQHITSFEAEELIFILSGAKVLICNDYEIQMILDKIGENGVLNLAEKIEIIIVTKGAKGSEIYHKNEKIIIPSAKPKNTCDPTGAGDAYRAGFIKGLLEGWPLEKAGRFAGLISVYAVETYGTQSYDFT